MANLWNDIDALARLANSEQAAAVESSGAPPVRGPVTLSAFPAFPEHDEFDIFAVDSPARVVTGDSFDYFFVSDDILAFMIADVSGKGIPAALLMGVTRSMVRNLSSVSASPAETLTRVNEILYQTDLGAMYVTILLAWYHTREGVLQYANAGHPLPYRIGASSRVEEFGEVTGPILGILKVKGYRDCEEQVGVGDRLVFYTDGVTEAISPGGDFLGPDGLTRLLRQHAAEPLDQLCTRLVADVMTFQGNNRQDDTTVMAFQRKS